MLSENLGKRCLSTSNTFCFSPLTVGSLTDVLPNQGALLELLKSGKAGKNELIEATKRGDLGTVGFPDQSPQRHSPPPSHVSSIHLMQIPNPDVDAH
mmetsp:Transcript_29854/g.114607  ORF Transcript_29854/g.114607 Transcript_29854/m.114607 type:complete len:97 (-) Transcript_29854:2073-2363(-)